jgi:hypothetical protein
MQPILAPGRDHLTADQVVRMIRDVPGMFVGEGLEVVDRDLQVLDDISAWFSGGSVSRNFYATLHGTARLGLSTALDWGRALVRPYYLIGDGQNVARFNLGAYYTAKPKHAPRDTPRSYEVECYDILKRLDDPVGDSYALAKGALVLEEVENLLQQQGYTRYYIDQDAAGKTMPQPFSRPSDESTTWLVVVNALLASVGYAGVWSDWDGVLHCEPYITSWLRPSEWDYDTTTDADMLDPERSSHVEDFDETPNRWVAFRSNLGEDDPPPEEGRGIYTYINQSTGPTSVDARDRVITKTIPLDAADQASLVARAQITIEADMTPGETIETPASPNPLHWHGDRVTVTDPGIGATRDCLVGSWSLPFGGELMSHTWYVL